MKRFGYFILLAWLALTFVMLDTMPTAWVGWTPDYCRGVNCYCEPIRDLLVAQPIATYSNLGFIAVGLFVMVTAIRRPKIHANPMTSNKGYPLLYGAALVCTGAFSFFYHASLTKVGDYVDLMGMYLFTSFFALYSLNRLRPMSGVTFLLVYFGLNAALALGLILAYDLQQIYFVALIAIALMAEAIFLRTRNPNIQVRYFGLALLVFGIGASAWLGDNNGLLPCNPAAPITWHGLWHLAAAAAALLMFLYYRSESFTMESPAADLPAELSPDED